MKKNLFNKFASLLFAKKKEASVIQSEDKKSGETYSIVTGPFCRTIVVPVPKKKP